MALPQRIVTLPERMAQEFAQVEARSASSWFATHDPGRPLGSGAGTANALLEAWRAEGGTLTEWLRSNRRIVIHAGGQSRRLPAYAAIGKALMPVPALRGATGQRPDQTLVDLHVEFCDRLFELAPESLRVMVISGDALLALQPFPSEIPEGDVVCLGIRADAETASHHGVFLVNHANPSELECFLQKPPVSQLQALEMSHTTLLDTGIWMFSEAAVLALLRKCGIEDPERDELREYELYSEFGLALGTHPTVSDPVIEGLAAKIVKVQGDFLHFGTSEQMIESVTRLHDLAHQSAPLGFFDPSKRHPNQHVQNVHFAGKPELRVGAAYWLENSFIGSEWVLEGENVVTGVPENGWRLHLPREVCLEVVLVASGYALRPYGYRDQFKGAIEDPQTIFLGKPLADWLSVHGLAISDLGNAGLDLQKAPLFPIVSDIEAAESLVRWMIEGGLDETIRVIWKASRRVSAFDLLSQTAPARVYQQRSTLAIDGLKAMQRNHAASVFYSLDLERTAELIHLGDPGFVPTDLQPGMSLVKEMHHHMFQSALLRLRGDERWEAEEAKSFGVLRDAIVDSLPAARTPRCGVASDQIVWARSPLRFDLAGGWTDTPPYCQLNGGRVLNVAIDLNGQPPVQVFIRRSERRDVLLRSIDLGTERRFETFEELSDDLSEKSEFSLAQGALAMAGFGRKSGAPSLLAVLDEFGGGIELSILAAVPKGSGLGTSSILAATILGAVNEFANLGWNEGDLMHQTLALEQILSTGGGWQDQAGGCMPGVKDLISSPGPLQRPVCRWLPERILGPENANQVVLLYYTGITRVAKSVLREIVRGMFLNSKPRLDTLARIRANVEPGVDAIQRNDLAALGETVRRSWQLNQELDSGTNPPAVQAILSQVDDYLLGAKLLGAGGGGFLLMVAKDHEAARRVRQTLEANPPSDRARFFDFQVSPTGLRVSRS